MTNNTNNTINTSIFYQEKDQNIDKVIAKEVENNLAQKIAIPTNYIPIKLDSLGKLSAPIVLHFRNYTMDEVVELSSARDDNYVNVLIKCLSNMVYEKDFDCAMLHEKEVEQILATIFLAFWGSVLPNYPYYIDENIEDSEKLNSNSNIGKANIDITKLKTKTLPENFKEPIKITIDGKTIEFRLPRIKDIIVAKSFVDRKYYEQERKYSDIKIDLEKNKSKSTVSYDDKIAYETYIEEKNKDFLRVLQSNLILGINGEKIESLENKFEIYKNDVSLDYWQEYQNYIDTNLNFGIDNEVTFFSLETGTNVTRRFQFQSLDFIPTVGARRDSRATISLGD